MRARFVAPIAATLIALVVAYRPTPMASTSQATTLAPAPQSGSSALAPQAGSSAPGAVDAMFGAVQPDLFSIPNSYSNAWGDFDSDGDLDLAVSTASGQVRLYRNDRGTFVSVGRELGMPQAGFHELRGLSWGDYDDDGDIDLLGGPTANAKVTVVLRNDRGTHFTDVAPDIGLTIPGRSARQSSWVDYDNDGDLDVYGSDRSGANALLQNNGGRFTQVMAGAGPSDKRATVGACWFDADLDGDLDLFLANQAGAADALWSNDITSFTDLAPKLGLAGPSRTPDQGGVGCAIGDYDNDGDFDIFVPNYGPNQLYRNNGDRTFTDVGKALGVGVDNHAVGAEWGDIDNDGDLDLSVISYVGAPGAQQPMNALFRNDGAAGFVNVLTKDSPLNRADHSTQLIDFDDDGGLDLSITDGYGPVGGHFLFRNLLPDAVKRRSLSVLVLNSKGHQTEFGAEVRVRNARGRIVASRLVAAAGGYNAQRAAPVHVGLTALDPVDVEVTFMSGDGRMVQTIRGVKPADFSGKSLVVRRGR